MARSASWTWERMLQMIAREYTEMPGLRLTAEQAKRLWTLEAETCHALLSELVATGFLSIAADGCYVRPSEVGTTQPSLRMAKAELARRSSTHQHRARA